jgi:small conductance mechanosensitive channel
VRERLDALRYLDVGLGSHLLADGDAQDGADQALQEPDAHKRDEEHQQDAQRRLDRVVTELIVDVAVLIVVVVTLMPEFGVNPGPMIAGLGLIGIAVGLGAQNLVKDVINGGFILVENQYGRNDVVTIAGVTGLVEDINLRRTTLRDLDGVVHFVPHSQVDVASNWTKGFSRVNLNVAVAYDSDLDRVFELIDRVGKEMAEDEAFAGKIKVPPHALRVDRFSENGVEIKIVGDTEPIEQWTVMGALRLRLKRAFDAEGIIMPSNVRAMQIAAAAAVSQDAAQRSSSQRNAPTGASSGGVE